MVQASTVRRVRALAAGLALTFAGGAAYGAVATYQGAGGLTNFNVDAGNPIIAIDFESLAGDIAGQTHTGVTFTSPDGNTLEVVAGASTFTPPGFAGVIDPDTNRLFPTSGRKVLSPGGVELAPGADLRERDSLQIDFVTPLSAFGLDILFQSYDCCTFVDYAVYGAGNALLTSGNIGGNGGGGGLPGGATFFGVISDAGDITRIVFTESDGNAQFPDANIGYDTFRFGQGGGVPEPATWGLMILGFGLAGVTLRRRATAGA